LGDFTENYKAELRAFQMKGIS